MPPALPVLSAWAGGATTGIIITIPCNITTNMPRTADKTTVFFIIVSPRSLS